LIVSAALQFICPFWIGIFLMNNDSKNRIYLAGTFLLAVTLTGTTGYYLLGHFAQQAPLWSLGDCFYMTVITLTTVGFAEIIDLTHVQGARLFTIFILLGGLGVAAYFVSTLTAFLVEGELTNVFWRKRMEKQIGKLTDHLIVCGAERVGAGYYVIKELLKTNIPFVLIDEREKLIKKLQGEFGYFPAVVGDPTHADYLQTAGVKRAKGVVSVLDDDKDNLCVVVTCKQLNSEINIISSCSNSEFAGKLELLGAEVVMPNSIGGLRIASQILRPWVVRYLDLMMRDKNCVVRIEDITLADSSPLIGKKVSDINFPNYAQLLVLALIRANTSTPIYNPKRSLIVEAGDTIIMQADVESLNMFRQQHG